MLDPRVELVETALDDFWIRDTGPLFAKAQGKKAGVKSNFNGWGGKQDCENDAHVADAVNAAAGVPTISTSLVFEGEGLEFDGEGTVIITESCFLNPNHNPGVGKKGAEKELSRLFGVSKVIWLPGIAGKDITDGHTDFYARFARPGVVVAGQDNDPESFDYDVTRKNLEILRSATDARGRTLTVEVIPGPSKTRAGFFDDDFAAGYINFCVCNGAVLVPEFGDTEADTTAVKTLSKLFPGRTIEQLNIDGVASGGGGIHCATQQEPA